MADAVEVVGIKAEGAGIRVVGVVRVLAAGVE